MESVLVEAAEACGDKIQIVQINADDNPFLSLCFGVQNIPTLLYFVQGEVCGRLVGTVSKEALLNLIFPDRGAAEGNASPTEGEYL